MGFFTKESHTHFERDEEENVISVERSGDEPKRNWFRSRTPVSKELEKEYYKEHPEKRMSSRLKSAGRSIDKHIVSKMQPIDMSHTTREQGGRRYRIRNNYNPIGSTFDRGISLDNDFIRYRGPDFSSRMKPKSSGHKGDGGRKYVVVGGKAYPVAGSGKKKKDKKKSRIGFDMMDNWGFMKKR